MEGSDRREERSQVEASDRRWRDVITGGCQVEGGREGGREDGWVGEEEVGRKRVGEGGGGKAGEEEGREGGREERK